MRPVCFQGLEETGGCFPRIEKMKMRLLRWLILVCAGAVLASCRGTGKVHLDSEEVGPALAAAYREPVDSEIRFPIFNYHHVSPLPTNASADRVTFTVTPGMLEQQLKYLKEHGYRSVPLDVLTKYFDRGTPIPPKAVALTFDDGWRDQHEYAFPLLKKYGFTATFFVPVMWIGHPKVMPWSELREMADAGMTIGTHGAKHLHFDQIGEPLLKKEIVDSKLEMEKYLGQPVLDIAYPGGHWTTQAIAVVRSAGYEVALGVEHDIIQSQAHRYDVRRFHAGNDLASITTPLTASGY
jgi:peptidoglycan/xylan/chitin deacetylase (PgdA/CDA1 family)